MVKKQKYEPLWEYEEPPSGTLNGSDLIAYLGRNKIQIRSEGDNITRFAKNHDIRFVVVKRPKGEQFGANPHYFYPPTKSKMEIILKKMNNNNNSFNGREILKKKKALINEIFNNGTNVDKLPKHLNDKVKTQSEREEKLGQYRKEHGLTKTLIAKKVYEKFGVQCNRKLVKSVLKNKSEEMIRRKLKKIG